MNRQVSVTLEPIEKEIHGYFNLDDPKSFLLFAGAGSGKTRTLVNVLKEVRKNDGRHLAHSGQKVAIITYTNAACNEIKHRLEYDPTFSVSTIHSFAWELIKPFTNDIREWLREELSCKIIELQAAVDKARDKNGKTALKNSRNRYWKQRRLERLDQIIEFTYSPTGDNTTRGALTHAEVISMSAAFLSEPLMQKVLVNRFPILLIDESQDTNKALLEALIATQQNQRHCFCLGLFGDMMQRIYGGGKHDLEADLPEDWRKPGKQVNWRCPKRVIRLINNIRNESDRNQVPEPDAEEGIVRLFIVDSNKADDKFTLEQTICQQMQGETEDSGWADSTKVKTLTLEHHLAARRGKFDDFFVPLLAVDKLKDAALNGTSNTINFLVLQLLPLILEIGNQDDFAIANIIRRYSPILSADNLDGHSDPVAEIQRANSAVIELAELLSKPIRHSIVSILILIKKLGLLSLPESFEPHLIDNKIQLGESVDDEDHSVLERDSIHQAWEAALSAPLKQLQHYADYISDNSGFGTHQGVKGLEFERVMVILDDAGANGFLFSYEKLLGAKELSANDLKKEKEGEDTTVRRTQRLFYVTCSRAEKSLAVVVYTQDPAAVKGYIQQSQWFDNGEVVVL
jgi:DNA helicase-2/ATP-dependent DNA helicase PcrA